MGVREEVAERFPSLLALLNQPEIGGLLTRAVSEQWSPGKFQSEFIASRWFRGQSESQRRWWVASATDPGEVKQQRESMWAAVGQKARELGVGISQAQLKWISEVALARGQDPGGQEVMNELAKLWDFKSRGRGAAGAARSQVQSLASQFFDTSVGEGSRAQRRNLDARALRVASGQDTLEAQQQRLTQAAMKRFPHMRDQLKLGMTPYEIIQPLRQIVAEEMEYASPDQVDVQRNAVWRQIMGIRDPKSGQTRLMTEAETIRLVRQQPSWWKTTNGRSADATMTRSIMNIFGKRKSGGMT